MNLRLRTPTIEQIHAHLRRAYPEEGCGVLLGSDRDGTREVGMAVAFENRREDSRHNRYLIGPEQVLAAEKVGRAHGLDVVGFYHSHPDHPAEPSSVDLENAWPFYSYVIASLEQGQVSDLKSWRLNPERTEFDSESIEVVPEPSPVGRMGEEPPA